MSRTEGPRARGAETTKAAILGAARERFAADGYERATIRAIAGDAEIDPALVIRYFGNKEKLFAAAANFDLGLPDLHRLAARPRRSGVGGSLHRSLGARRHFHGAASRSGHQRRRGKASAGRAGRSGDR